MVSINNIPPQKRAMHANYFVSTSKHSTREQQSYKLEVWENYTKEVTKEARRHIQPINLFAAVMNAIKSMKDRNPIIRLQKTANNSQKVLKAMFEHLIEQGEYKGHNEKDNKGNVQFTNVSLGEHEVSYLGISLTNGNPDSLPLTRWRD